MLTVMVEVLAPCCDQIASMAQIIKELLTHQLLPDANVDGEDGPASEKAKHGVSDMATR